MEKRTIIAIAVAVVALLAALACALFLVLGAGGRQTVPEPTPTLGELPQPVINFPIEGVVGQPVTFDGSESRPGSSPIASYAWDFGDGTQGNGAVVDKVYNAAGTYQVTLTVTDQNGFSNVGGPVQITIRSAGTPTPSPSTPMATPAPPGPTPTIPVLPQPVINSPNEGVVGQPVTFDGSESRPGSNPIASYAWDFGDGTQGNGVVVDKVYNAAGTYQVTLTVTDQNGFSNVGGPVQITIRSADTPTPLPSTPTATPVPPEPTPTIPVLPQPVINFPNEGVVGQPVTFDGSESRPGSNPIASYEWDFGDGTQGNGAVVDKVYNTAGTYDVTLTVTDNAGVGNVGGPVQITIKGEELEPTPTIPVLPQPVINFPAQGVVGQPVTFDGSESRPGSNLIASYAWDFGDGTQGNGAVVDKVYNAAGTYDVTLTVTDNAGFDNVGGPVQIEITE